MLLENLMEEKQLDFSRPFLSVRRAASSTPPPPASKPATASTKPLLPPLPHYKPELKSGPIRVPGTVPFVWERSPGRPKNNETPTATHDHLPPVVPRLPPGKRASMLNNVHSDPVGGSEEGSSSPAASCSDFRSSSSPNVEGVMESDDNDDDEDESFVDALDTLSRTESSLLNCSVSGISGVDMRPNRTLSGDLHAREFMIGRFLPAAQAMANGTPQYSEQYRTKRQPVLREQARQITPVNKPPPRGDIVPYYAQCDNNTVEDDDDDDDDDDVYSEPDTSSLGVCGFFPGFCLQNRLNPVPGIRKQVSSVRTRRVEYDKAAEHGRRVMNEPPRQQSGNRIKQTIDDSRTRCQPAASNAGWSHNETSQLDAFKAKGFLGVPAERDNKGLETMGSILAVKEVISFAELLAHDDLEWESSKSRINSVQTVEEKSAHVEKTASFGACDRSNVPQADDRRDQDLMVFAAATIASKGDDSSRGSIKDSTNFTRQKLGGRGGGGGDHNTRPSQRKPCPLPLPLPKSPSESWLKKALPAVSSRTQMSKSPLGMILMHQQQHPKGVEDHSTTTNSSDPTWETIVKSSGEKNRRFQFSEQGQLTPIPEA
ncbi:hypothetical protein LINGRAHAP2_LOCUS18641 [Linum grandiflorum]